MKAASCHVVLTHRRPRRFGRNSIERGARAEAQPHTIDAAFPVLFRENSEEGAETENKQEMPSQ